MSRRRLLKTVGIGGGAVLASGAAGTGIRGVTNGAWDSGRGEPYELWRSWQDAPGLHRLVAAGALAANPHNIQPWLFATGEDTIDLRADPGRVTPVSDPYERERMAGYGCALQNISLAARAEGLQARIAPWPDDDPCHLARVEIEDGAPPSEREQQLAGAIGSRHTDRGAYDSRIPDQDLLDGLTDGGPDGAELFWVTETGAMTALGELYGEATQEFVDDQEMSAEAFSWFRNDRADIDGHRDGLTLDCQGLDGLTLFMAKILPAQSRRSSDDFWVRRTREVHTATARAWGIIRVDDVGDPHARVAGGRLLQHVHLAATASGLGLHHMNQISERIDRCAVLGGPDRFSGRWAETTGVPAGQSLLAFRIGYPERAPRPSPRRGLAEIVEEA